MGSTHRLVYCGKAAGAGSCVHNSCGSPACYAVGGGAVNAIVNPLTRGQTVVLRPRADDGGTFRKQSLNGVLERLNGANETFRREKSGSPDTIAL